MDAAPKRSLAFYYCARCAFVGQETGASGEGDYTEVARATSRQLPDYAAQVAKELRHGTDWQTRLIIEVGANDGTFLNLLARDGYQHRLAIEPSTSLAQACSASGHVVENVHLNAATAPAIRERHGAAHTVVCRHTLEHVPDALEFLNSMRILLATGGLLFVEVPAVSPILERLWAFELWDEHISYFSPQTLRRLISRAGFSILRIEERTHRGSTNILCWAAASDVHATTGNSEADESSLALCENFRSRWEAYADFARRQVSTAQGPVFAVGASHPQSNFLNFSGLGLWIEALVDDDPMKAGRYVALPQPKPVITTASLVDSAGNGTVLMTAFGYPGWMNSIREQLAGRAVRFVDPLEDLSRY